MTRRIITRQAIRPGAIRSGAIRPGAIRHGAISHAAITPATILGLAATLGACAVPAPRPAAPAPVAIPYTSAGLERVIGQNAGALTRLFGQPDADVREGPARKLQFVGPICVLDAYLYPKGSDEPRVTYLDAREPDGSTIDRASCVAALIRRDGGK